MGHSREAVSYRSTDQTGQTCEETRMGPAEIVASLKEALC